jgi:hypothetical protein
MPYRIPFHRDRRSYAGFFYRCLGVGDDADARRTIPPPDARVQRVAPRLLTD